MDTHGKVQDCNLPSNLGHLLNGCKKSLDRFKFRHNSVLAHLTARIAAHKPETMEVYADLEGWQVNGGTDRRTQLSCWSLLVLLTAVPIHSRRPLTVRLSVMNG